MPNYIMLKLNKATLIPRSMRTGLILWVVLFGDSRLHASGGFFVADALDATLVVVVAIEGRDLDLLRHVGSFSDSIARLRVATRFFSRLLMLY